MTIVLKQKCFLLRVRNGKVIGFRLREIFLKKQLKNLNLVLSKFHIKGKSHRVANASCKVIPLPKIDERIPPIRFRKAIPTSWIELKISEGKNRQVRKMTAAVGHPTLRLIRYSVDDITLDGLKIGEATEFSPLTT